MPFDLGDTVRLTAECRDPDGTLMNAGTATLTVTLPDGSTVSPAVPAPTSAGQYVYDYPTTSAGRHAVRWLFETPNSARTDVFDVRPETPALLLSLADAKAQLNITSARSDEEIRGWLETVTGIVEHFTGVTVQRSFTEVHRLPRRGTPAFALLRTPALEITAATGADPDVMDLDTTTGVVHHAVCGLFCGRIEVTYLAGRDQVPAPIRDAAKIILQHLWRTQRNTSRGPVPGGGDDFSVTEPVPGLGYAVPNRALQLMEPYKLPPGVA